MIKIHLCILNYKRIVELDTCLKSLADMHIPEEGLRTLTTAFDFEDNEEDEPSRAATTRNIPDLNNGLSGLTRNAWE